MLLSWLALVAVAPCAIADDEAAYDAQPRTTRSALATSRSGSTMPAESSAYLAHEVDQDPAVDRAQYADSGEPQDVSGAEVDLVETPGFFSAPDEMFGAMPNPFVPAPAVSSGNWLRNCHWYTEQSAVYLSRTTNVKNDVELALDLADLNPLDVRLDLGYEPGLRSTIGRFLGRDARNRGHSVEFTFLGLTHWQYAQSYTAEVSGALFQSIDPLADVPVYDGSDTQAYDLTSDFNTYEANYRIERRLGRDRMVYSRDSRWVREATPSLLCSVYAGVRAAFVNERIDWTASSLVTGNGRYVVDTHNSMVGPQVGGELFYERAYWRAGVRGNGGALVNWASQSSTVRILNPEGAPLVPNRDEYAKDHTLGFVGGLNFVGEYRFRPTFGLRVSYDLLWVTSLALAQNQLTFFPSTPTEISQSHTLFFQGVTFGFEWFR